MVRGGPDVSACRRGVFPPQCLHQSARSPDRHHALGKSRRLQALSVGKPDEPGGGIIGAAGLMLGLSAQRGIDAACLMGETSGYLVDPMSAANVLFVLSKLIDVPVDPTKLNDRASEMEKVIEGLVEGEKKDEELSYIG